jgi:hypothetical protein
MTAVKLIFPDSASAFALTFATAASAQLLQRRDLSAPSRSLSQQRA